MSTSSFCPFLSLPPEIHGLILSRCSTNDQTCLRLTCKYLYNFSNTPKEALSLAYPDAGYLCESSEKAISEPINPWFSRYEHRRRCHDICYAAAVTQANCEGRPNPRPRQKCSTRRWAQHCECFAGKIKLYQRLRGWMPRGLRYCGQCNRFTKRKLQHKGRCYHGLPKQRKSKSNFWTYYSHRGGFGGYRVRMWSKWFNNQSMNRFEARLGVKGSPGRGTRGGERYDFRELAPKAIDTQNMRY